MGACKGREDDSIVPFMAWLGLRLRTQEAIIIHENVPGFDETTLTESLGDLYNLDSCVLTPTMFGWPSERNRAWRVLLHREKCSGVMEKLGLVQKVFQRTCSLSWHTYVRLCTEEDEKSELDWASSRPTSLATAAPELYNAKFIQGASKWELALTTGESKNLKRYRELFPSFGPYSQQFLASQQVCQYPEVVGPVT